jgi:hypothetical protein
MQAVGSDYKAWNLVNKFQDSSPMKWKIICKYKLKRQQIRALLSTDLNRALIIVPFVADATHSNR